MIRTDDTPVPALASKVLVNTYTHSKACPQFKGLNAMTRSEFRHTLLT